MAMRFGAAFWVQRTGWPELREAVLRAEAAGFDDLWIDDHLLCDEGDWPDAKLEAWTTLAAIAAITERARLGHLVSANTLRNPGLTAKMATTIDHVSGGRTILGIGAGWFEREHEAFGFDFGTGIGERLDRLVEAVPLLRRLLDGETVTHEGRFYTFRDAICAPRPVQDHLPILIGGSGPREDAPARRPVRGHVEHLRDAGRGGGGRRDPAGGLRGRRAGRARDRAHGEPQRGHPADRAEAEAAWAGWMAVHRPQDGEAALAAGGPIEEVAASLPGTGTPGFAHPILVFRTPFDLETMDRLPDLRAALGRLTRSPVSSTGPARTPPRTTFTRPASPVADREVSAMRVTAGPPTLALAVLARHGAGGVRHGEPVHPARRQARHGRADRRADRRRPPSPIRRCRASPRRARGRRRPSPRP